MDRAVDRRLTFAQQLVFPPDLRQLGRQARQDDRHDPQRGDQRPRVLPDEPLPRDHRPKLQEAGAFCPDREQRRDIAPRPLPNGTDGIYRQRIAVVAYDLIGKGLTRDSGKDLPQRVQIQGVAFAEKTILVDLSDDVARCPAYIFLACLIHINCIARLSRFGDPHQAIQFLGRHIAHGLDNDAPSVDGLGAQVPRTKLLVDRDRQPMVKFCYFFAPVIVIEAFYIKRLNTYDRDRRQSCHIIVSAHKYHRFSPPNITKIVENDYVKIIFPLSMVWGKFPYFADRQKMNS